MTHIHTEVVAGLVTELEAGDLPWWRPWSDGDGVRLLSAMATIELPCCGINTLLLWHSAAERDLGDYRRVTFNQAKALDGIRTGERGTRIVFAKQFFPEEERRSIAVGEIADDLARRVWCLRRYSVFDLWQTHRGAAPRPCQR